MTGMPTLSRRATGGVEWFRESGIVRRKTAKKKGAFTHSCWRQDGRDRARSGV